MHVAQHVTDAFAPVHHLLEVERLVAVGIEDLLQILAVDVFEHQLG